jgi:hypothetical protein
MGRMMFELRNYRRAASRRLRVTFSTAGAAAALLLLTGTARADLALETETARLLPQGRFELSMAAEWQTSSQGQEFALPLALSVGVLDRMELLVEPVPFTSIQPNSGKPANGLGDTEVTLQYLLLDEQTYLPAVAAAFEVKIPTARNLQIGTKEFDYRVYAIASKRVGDFDLHVNVGYTFVGEPQGVRTKDPIDAAFAVEWFINPKYDLFAEVTYVASSLASGAGGGGETPDLGGAVSEVLTAEVGGEEIVGSAGVRYHVTSDFDVFGSFSYDNKDEKLFRLGASWRF